MLFELNNPQSLASVCESQTLIFEDMDPHLPFDYYVLGYCVSALGCSWKVTITRKTDENIEMLTKGITKLEKLNQ